MEEDTSIFDWATHAWSDETLEFVKEQPLPTAESPYLHPVYHSLREVLTDEEYSKFGEGMHWLTGAPVPSAFLIRLFSYLIDEKEISAAEAMETAAVQGLVESACRIGDEISTVELISCSFRAIFAGFEKADEIDHRKLTNVNLLSAFLTSPHLSAGRLSEIWDCLATNVAFTSQEKARLMSTLAENPNTPMETLTRAYHYGVTSLKRMSKYLNPKVGNQISDDEHNEWLATFELTAVALSNKNFPAGVYEPDQNWWMSYRRPPWGTAVSGTNACILLPWYATEAEVLRAWKRKSPQSKPLTQQNMYMSLASSERYNFEHIPSISAQLAASNPKFPSAPGGASEDAVLRWADISIRSGDFHIPPDLTGEYSEQAWIALFHRLDRGGSSMYADGLRRALMQVCNNPSAPDWFKMKLGSGEHFDMFFNGWIAYHGGFEAYAAHLGFSNIPNEWAGEVIYPLGID